MWAGCSCWSQRQLSSQTRPCWGCSSPFSPLLPSPAPRALTNPATPAPASTPGCGVSGPHAARTCVSTLPAPTSPVCPHVLGPTRLTPARQSGCCHLPWTLAPWVLEAARVGAGFWLVSAPGPQLGLRAMPGSYDTVSHILTEEWAQASGGAVGRCQLCPQDVSRTPRAVAPCRVSEGGCLESQLKGWAVFVPVLPGCGMGCSDPVDPLYGELTLWRERWDTAQLPGALVSCALGRRGSH